MKHKQPTKEQIASNRNRVATNKICKDLYTLYKIKPSMSERYIRLVNGMVLHNIAEEALNYDKGRLKGVTIEIPYIGELEVHIENEDIVVDSLILEERYKESIYNALVHGKSPLIDIANEKLIETLKNKYKSL